MNAPNSRPPRRRPLNDTRRAQVAATLLDIARHLTAPHAAAVQDLRHTITTSTGYPTRASGAGGGAPSNEVDDDGTPAPPSTSVERAVTDPHPAIAQAQATIDRLNTLEQLATRVLADLEADNPNRVVKRCPRCTAPWDSRWTRCQATHPNGGQCGARLGESVDGDRDRGLCGNPHCPDADQPLLTGDQKWGPSTNDGVTRHATCARYWLRYQRERGQIRSTDATASIERLQLDNDTILKETTP